MKLSHRLQTIYNQTLPGLPLWDICCDHGQLGLYAYHEGKVSSIHFVDQVPPIMEQLEQTYRAHIHNDENPLQTTFTTLDAGKVTEPLTGSVVVAGVGGMNMLKMVDSWISRGVLNAHRLVLSPHRDEALYERPDLFIGYSLTDKRIVLENGHLRFIFTFDRLLQ